MVQKCYVFSEHDCMQRKKFTSVHLSFASYYLSVMPQL